jgi:hypothetical protein
VAAAPELVRGDAASAEWERLGWSSLELGCALFTVYRAGSHSLAFSADLVAELLATPYGDERAIGWFKHHPHHDAASEAIGAAIVDANASWFHYPLANMEHPAVHRYPIGAQFPPHTDRVPMIHAGLQCGLRAANATVMLQPAKRGGALRFHLSYRNTPRGPEPDPIELELEPGDVAVYDANVVHEITRIDAGERVAFVAHALRAVEGPRDYA